MKKIEQAAVRATTLQLNLFFLGAEAVGLVPKDKLDDILSNIISKGRLVVKDG